ncbi:hypothetical protein DRO66_08110 [Candidatus Bathyarchaeota archaeon]|nr:MAG: hypothetical protein DRO66_08110 [Candidatus Bathyarchaeota archaeon]
MNNRFFPNIVSVLLCIGILTVLFAISLMNLTPPISRDALIHHLAIPKLWIKHGGFYETPWAVYSYNPMNIDLLYLASLYFKNDIAPKFIHFAFGLATGLLVYLYLKQRLSRNWGLLGGLIYLSTPVVIRLSTSAYVDLGLVFFTTASILALIRWQDGNYGELRWLIISAGCMGLAAGSKYNALIPWFFLNLMVAFYYSRDTKNQLHGVKYALIFFALTFMIVSPWYIKNHVLTSNPLYPLFNKVFNPAHHAGGQAGSAGIHHLLQRRELMYEESLWETLLIPIRMFFQGKDNSDQYFDGVLNPILIVMLPFAFFNKEFARDKVFFLSFSLFFLVIALFLTVPRVRYILPVVPFLAILAVMGMKGLVDRFKNSRGLTPRIGLIGTFLVAIILVGCNGLYLKEYFNTIQPIGYILNQETKDEFLARNLRSYSAMRYVNENLPANARIFLIFLAGRGYYLDRAYYHEPSFGMAAINSMVKCARSAPDFKAYLESLGCTHILVRNSLFEKYLQDNFQKEVVLRFLGFTRLYWKTIYESNGYTVYEISESFEA